MNLARCNIKLKISRKTDWNCTYFSYQTIHICTVSGVGLDGGYSKKHATYSHKKGKISVNVLKMYNV